MKKLLSILMVLVMVFALAACTSEDVANAKFQAYINAHGDELVESMEQSFASSSGLTCTSSIEAKDGGLVITLNINELDNVDEEIKNQMQEGFNSVQGSFDVLLDDLQEEVPEAKHLTLKICEKDGDLIAKIVAKD